MEWQNINQQHISTSFVYTLKIHDLEASRQAEYPEAPIPELHVMLYPGYPWLATTIV